MQKAYGFNLRLAKKNDASKLIKPCNFNKFEWKIQCVTVGVFFKPGLIEVLRYTNTRVIEAPYLSDYLLHHKTH